MVSRDLLAFAGCGSTHATSAGTPYASGASLARCISTWQTGTSSDARSVVQAAAAGGHTRGLMFRFKGGQCGLTVSGLGIAATYADIASNGHFEPWINTSNGSPSASILPVANALAARAESQPNVTLASDGSVSP